MGRISYSQAAAVALVVLTAIICAVALCGRKADAEGMSATDMTTEKQAGLASHLDSAANSNVSRRMSDERRQAAEMRIKLDDGQEREALHMARGLMDSNDPEVRSQCVTVLGWIGREAMPELLEMTSDRDSTVAEAAREEWEKAINDISDDDEYTALVCEAAQNLSDQRQVESLLFKFSTMDDVVALAALGRIIEANEGKMVAECAREMYEHVSGGEIYETPQKTAELIRSLEKMELKK